MAAIDIISYTLNSLSVPNRDADVEFLDYDTEPGTTIVRGLDPDKVTDDWRDIGERLGKPVSVRSFDDRFLGRVLWLRFTDKTGIVQTKTVQVAEGRHNIGPFRIVVT